MRGRVLLGAVLVVVGVAVAVIAITTVGQGLWKSSAPQPSTEQTAEDRCAHDVAKRLVAPGSAAFTDVRTEAGTLDVDGRDFSSLNSSEPLKGVDRSRITVLNVSGVVQSPSEVGTTIRDHFDCRAYFLDGSLAHTLVVFDHAH